MSTKINGSTGIDKIQDGVVSETKLDNILGGKIEQIKGYNYIINGNFDIWQRGTSQTLTGYGSADRWACKNIGTTKTAFRATFALGQTYVPDNPNYYMRHVVTSVAGANNYCILEQRLESVKTLAGKTATLSFWAQADSNKNIAIEVTQIFGSGGTPSSSVGGISQLVALTTSWKKYTITVDIPSIAGKILGTDGNDYVGVLFWFDAGSTHATRSANLGQQSGTFDIANVSLVEGDIDVKPIPRSYGEELALCQRYYETSSGGQYSAADGVGGFKMSVYFNTTKRTIPFVTSTQTGGGTIASTIACFLIWGTSANTPIGTWAADAEL